MIFWAKNMSPFFLLHFPILLTEWEIIYNRNKCKFKAFYPVLKHFSPFFLPPFNFFPSKLQFFFPQRQTPPTTTVYCIMHYQSFGIVNDFKHNILFAFKFLPIIKHIKPFRSNLVFIRDGHGFSILKSRFSCFLKLL